MWNLILFLLNCNFKWIFVLTKLFDIIFFQMLVFSSICIILEINFLHLFLVLLLHQLKLDILFHTLHVLFINFCVHLLQYMLMLGVLLFHLIFHSILFHVLFINFVVLLFDLWLKLDNMIFQCLVVLVNWCLEFLHLFWLLQSVNSVERK